MVGDAIKERGGHLGIAEHGGPFAEGEVGESDSGASSGEESGDGNVSVNNFHRTEVVIS